MDLLERGPQLAALVEYAEDAARGRARLVLVAGEAGAGKTALVEALRGQVPEARWLVGACDGLFTPRPLGPLLDVAEQTGGELAALCERTDVPRAQLFRALVRDLTTHEGATVLVVEDVHWADRATLDLVHHLSRGIDGARLLVVLTYRDDPADVPPDLTRLLGDLVRQGSTRHVTVPPLTREAVATLTARSGIGPDELLRLTGGNPFFLTEVLAVATDQIPSTARSAVLSRVVGLGPGARRALEEVALLGVRVELEVARAVTGLTPQELDELVANGVLRADDEVVAFRHEIARRAIADTVPEHRLADVHRRAQSVLEEAGCTDHARLAHHADGAGDSALVLVHAPLAARARRQAGCPPAGGRARRARRPARRPGRSPAAGGAARAAAGRARRHRPVVRGARGGRTRAGAVGAAGRPRGHGHDAAADRRRILAPRPGPGEPGGGAPGGGAPRAAGALP